MWLVFQVMAIVVVASIYIFDLRYLSTPPLHSDDWTILSGYLFDGSHLIDLNNRRPLLAVPYELLTSIFGLNLPMYYFMNAMVIFLTGMVLFFLIKECSPNFQWMALPGTLLFLIYPIDFSKTWLIHIHARTVLLVDLLVILLMVHYVKRGKPWRIILVNILFLISMMIYEAGLGIVLLTAILLIYLNRNQSKKRALALSSVLLSGILFILWRLVLQPRYFSVQDNYLNQITFSLPELAFRYLQGLFIALFNWVGPLMPDLGQTRYYIFLGILLTILIMVTATLPGYLKSAKNQKTFPWEDRKKLIKAFSVLLLISGLFWAFGYIPIISYSAPTLFGDDSRFSLFATLGTALAFLAFLALCASLVVRSPDQIKRVTTIVIIPFILIGAVYQIWSQNERFKAWDVQKAFWNGMFDVAPEIKDNTRVGIIISGYEGLNQFEILPFLGNWEARSALRVLYNNPTLNALYFYSDRPESSYNEFPTQADWSQYIFVAFNPVDSTIRLIENAQDDLLAHYKVNGYNPLMRISEASTNPTLYRRLVSTPQKIIEGISN